MRPHAQPSCPVATELGARGRYKDSEHIRRPQRTRRRARTCGVRVRPRTPRRDVYSEEVDAGLGYSMRRSVSFLRSALLNIAAPSPPCPQRRSSVRRSGSFAKWQSQCFFVQPASGNVGACFNKKRFPSSARAASHGPPRVRISTAANRSAVRAVRDGACRDCGRRHNQRTTAANTATAASVAISIMEPLSVL